MIKEKFLDLIKTKAPVGTVLINPGGGTSKIMSYAKGKVCYKRGNSRFYLNLEELWKAYNNFKGQKVTTSDLKQFCPEIYDSKNNGHNCHCTLLFLLLKEIRVIDKIRGEGKAGNPFYAIFQDVSEASPQTGISENVSAIMKFFTNIWKPKTGRT